MLLNNITESELSLRRYWVHPTNQINLKHSVTNCCKRIKSTPGQSKINKIKQIFYRIDTNLTT